MLKDRKINCFLDVYREIKKFGDSEKSLIPNTIVLIELLSVNPFATCTPGRSYSTVARLTTRLRSTMTNIRFNAIAVQNIVKDLIDDVDLVEVGNGFISSHDERHQNFGKFEKSDFL